MSELPQQTQAARPQTGVLTALIHVYVVAAIWQPAFKPFTCLFTLGATQRCPPWVDVQRRRGGPAPVPTPSSATSCSQYGNPRNLSACRIVRQELGEGGCDCGHHDDEVKRRRGKWATRPLVKRCRQHSQRHTRNPQLLTSIQQHRSHAAKQQQGLQHGTTNAQGADGPARTRATAAGSPTSTHKTQSLSLVVQSSPLGSPKPEAHPWPKTTCTSRPGATASMPAQCWP